eukprot:704016-Amphidinium_carterae.2
MAQEPEPELEVAVPAALSFHRTQTQRLPIECLARSSLCLPSLDTLTSLLSGGLKKARGGPRTSFSGVHLGEGIWQGARGLLGSWEYQGARDHLRRILLRTAIETFLAEAEDQPLAAFCAGGGLPRQWWKGFWASGPIMPYSSE